MPPSLKLGTPIIVDLQALLGSARSEVINLEHVRAKPRDAILVRGAREFGSGRDATCAVRAGR